MMRLAHNYPNGNMTSFTESIGFTSKTKMTYAPLHGKLTAKKDRKRPLQKFYPGMNWWQVLPDGRLYVISNDEQDPQQVYVTEIWDDKTAHDASLQMPQYGSSFNRLCHYWMVCQQVDKNLPSWVVMAFEYLYPNFQVTLIGNGKTPAIECR